MTETSGTANVHQVQRKVLRKATVLQSLTVRARYFFHISISLWIY